MLVFLLFRSTKIVKEYNDIKKMRHSTLVYRSLYSNSPFLIRNVFFNLVIGLYFTDKRLTIGTGMTCSLFTDKQHWKQNIIGRYSVDNIRHFGWHRHRRSSCYWLTANRMDRWSNLMHRSWFPKADKIAQHVLDIVSKCRRNNQIEIEGTEDLNRTN